MVDAVIETPGGRIKLSVEADPEPAPLTSLLPMARALGDSLLTVAIDHSADQNRPVSCRAGCMACCHQTVPVTAPEAFDLLDHVQSLNDAARTRLEARFEDAQRKIEEAGLSDRLHPSDETETATLRRAYFGLAIRCPFLGADGLCTVYEIRPFACREHLVTSDPARCDEPASGDVALLPVVAHMGSILADLASEMWPSAPSTMPLTETLNWARQNSALRQIERPGSDLVGDFFAALER